MGNIQRISGLFQSHFEKKSSLLSIVDGGVLPKNVYKGTVCLFWGQAIAVLPLPWYFCAHFQAALHHSEAAEAVRLSQDRV